MSWAALTSGGKDSILSIQKALDSGKDVEYIVTARPKNRDSYMFHSANLDAVAAIAKVAGMKYQRDPDPWTQGGGTLLILESGLASLDVEGVIAGAVASVYQAERVRAITDRLGIIALHTALAYGYGNAPQGGRTTSGCDDRCHCCRRT